MLMLGILLLHINDSKCAVISLGCAAVVVKLLVLRSLSPEIAEKRGKDGQSEEGEHPAASAGWPLSLHDLRQNLRPELVRLAHVGSPASNNAWK